MGDIKLTEARKEPRIMEEARLTNLLTNLSILLGSAKDFLDTSVHAAGVVISEGGMENYVPVYKSETAN